MESPEKKEGAGEESQSETGAFKHYKVMIKSLSGSKPQYQNLEIFTQDLQRLLEMRRIHNHAFSAAAFPFAESRHN